MTSNIFVNNRLQGWSYDAAGGLTNDGSINYARDAAGELVQSGTSASYDVNPGKYVTIILTGPLPET